jgi:hypothetical protein
MSIQSIQQLRAALSGDLKKLGTEGFSSDPTRKTFTTRVHGAVIEFGHKQLDPAFWTGVKHYGSGPSSRFRMRRSVAVVAPVKKPAVRRKAKVAEVPAVG